MITEETRREAFEQRPVTRQTLILQALGDKEMTAREIANDLGYDDPNAVRPRLTELMQAGKVEAVGKRKDPISNITVAVFARV